MSMTQNTVKSPPCWLASRQPTSPPINYSFLILLPTITQLLFVATSQTCNQSNHTQFKASQVAQCKQSGLVRSPSTAERDPTSHFTMSYMFLTLPPVLSQSATSTMTL